MTDKIFPNRCYKLMKDPFNDQLLVKRLYRSAVALMVVLAVGSMGYPLLVEGATWFEGLYMSFLTVTTIGFHEVVDTSQSVGARIFTIFLAISGIGVLTYGLSNMAALIIELDKSPVLKRRRLQRIIRRMDNHFIICGASHVGQYLASELDASGRSFIVVDLNAQIAEEYEGKYTHGKVVEGDCTDSDFLQEVGIEKARGAFVTTGDDNLNIVICVTLRQLNPRLRIVSNAKDRDAEKKLLSVGADRVISPSYIGALRMASEMVRPTVTSFLDEMLRDTNRDLRIEEFSVSESWAGRPISELPLHGLRYSLVLAINSAGDWMYNPDPAHVLQPQSRLIMMTSTEELNTLKTRME